MRPPPLTTNFYRQPKLTLINIKPAPLIWKKDTPFSLNFSDFYFNTDRSIEDSLYVYFNANEIPTRINSSSRNLTIAETGFGTGLNFLLTAQQWLKYSSKQQHLHFISVEKHPISPHDLERTLNQCSLPDSTSSRLLEQYPHLCRGFHRLFFPEEHITLTLVFDDAISCYQSLQASIDVWYLDGFSPSKNPDMWTDTLFTAMARLSHNSTTFSTFTSAGVVRRGLINAGFNVKKKKGFGLKREMLTGTFSGTPPKKLDPKPWFSIPSTERTKEVTIIGGGLSGCSTAYALAQRGIKVTLIEKESQLASAGSGNRQGALYAKLPVTPTKQGELHLSGFLYSVNFLKQNDPSESFWSQCGVAQLATKESESKKQQELVDNQHYPDSLVQAKTADELSNICGSSVAHNGLFFPDAGWVSPVDFCHFLADHPNITISHRDIRSITHTDNYWQLTDHSNEYLHCSHLVICNAELANQFSATEHLPLKAIRGQVSITPQDAVLPELKTVICGDGYISPSQDGKFCFGATFDLKGKERNVTTSDHNKNLEKLSTALPDFHKVISEKSIPLDGRTAFRCSTPDYMPIVGPAPIYDEYVETFSRLRKDKNWRFDGASAKHHPNLYLNTGHGSKGLITCPISAELLASMMCNEPLPLPKNLVDAINPSRFIIKNLIKQAI